MNELKIPNKFSKNQLIVFGLLFALIGGIIIWRSFALNPNLPGDVNNDNVVNITDMSILLSNYGTNYSAADFNNSGLIDITDLSILLTNYNRTYSPPTPPPPSTGGVPTPIAGKGYSLVFNDDFNSFNTNVWTDHIWYLPSIPGAVYVQNGELITKMRRADGWREVDASTGGKKSWTFGYFEARMKWTSTPGAWPAFWLFSQAHQNGQTSSSLLTSEIDILEGDGKVNSGYNTALHKNTSNGFGIQDQVCPSNNWNQDIGAGNITADYHIYSVLWTSTTVTWYFDSRQIASCPVFANSTNQPMFLILSMWPGGALSGHSTPPSTAPAEIISQFDWVKVWQKP